MKLYGVIFWFTGISPDGRFIVSGYLSGVTRHASIPSEKALRNIENELAKQVREPLIHDFHIRSRPMANNFAITDTQEIIS